MYFGEISSIIHFCQQNNYFQALAVFVSFIDGSVIIIQNKNRQLKYVNPKIYSVKIYTDIEIYQKILERDIEVANLFSHTIILFDRIRVTPRILSAIEPIKFYNRYVLTMDKSNYCISSNEISLLFRDVDDTQSFISTTFLSICKAIKNHLSNAQYMIDWQYGPQTSLRNILVTFFVQSCDKEAILRKLQLYLYENVSELHLSRIQIPFMRSLNYIDSLSENIRMNTYDILCSVSEEYIAVKSSEDLTDNKGITQLTYYYLLAAKYYFKSLSEFLNVNDYYIDIMVEESISEFTKTYLQHDSILAAKAKILHEYNRLCDLNKVALSVNYDSLIHNWIELPITDDSIQVNLSKLMDVRNCIDDNAVSKDCVLNYFYDFYKMLFSCLDLPSYYKGYVPYCIKYLAK